METETFIRELARECRPVIPVARPVVGFLRWATAMALAVSLGVCGFGMRPDIGEASAKPAFLLLAALTLALGASSALSAFVARIPDRTQPWKDAVPVAVLILVAMALAFACASTDLLHAGIGVACVRRILTLAVPPSVSLFVSLRSAAPLRVSRAGALSALSASALGALGTQFVCRHDDPLHILVWHFVPVAILAGVGAVLGRWLLTWEGGWRAYARERERPPRPASDFKGESGGAYD